jgi:hypothetical protein
VFTTACSLFIDVISCSTYELTTLIHSADFIERKKIRTEVIGIVEGKEALKLEERNRNTERTEEEMGKEMNCLKDNIKMDLICIYNPWWIDVFRDRSQ